MGTEIIKILRFIINATKISNYVYKETGDRLAILTSFDLMKDEEVASLATSRSIREYTRNLEILGSASAKHAFGFLKLYEGRVILKRILENSTFVNSGFSIDDFLDEATEQMAKMAENDPF